MDFNDEVVFRFAFISMSLTIASRFCCHWWRVKTVFDKDQCYNILKSVAEETLSHNPVYAQNKVIWFFFRLMPSTWNDSLYFKTKVGQWISEICEKCTKKLVGLNKPFKYIVTCVIMQVYIVALKRFLLYAREWTKNLVDLSKPFKYLVTCVIMDVYIVARFLLCARIDTKQTPLRWTVSFVQRNGAGLHSASTCFWDSANDGSCSARWLVRFLEISRFDVRFAWQNWREEYVLRCYLLCSGHMKWQRVPLSTKRLPRISLYTCRIFLWIAAAAPISAFDSEYGHNFRKSAETCK